MSIRPLFFLSPLPGSKKQLPVSWILAGLIVGMTCLFTHSIRAETAHPSNLRCEYLGNPIGVDVAQPRLSWEFPNAIRGDQQTAFRIKVSSSPGGNGDVWDSGKLLSNQSIHVAYKGKPLESGQRCYWTVETFGSDGMSRGVSEEASWSMGLLNKSDWEGSWIEPGSTMDREHIWYRKQFTLNAAADSAFAYIASRGFHELYLNGKRVDSRLMAPTLTSLDDRIHYVTYDMGPFLKEGENVIAIWYGPGWSIFRSYLEGPRAVKAQIEIKAGGQEHSIYTDSSWKWKRSSSEHVGGWGHTNSGGERIKADLIEPDWNALHYDDSSWANAKKINFSVTLSSEMINPDRIIEKIPVTKTVKTDTGYEISLEKNFTGFIKVLLKGQPNTEAVMKIKDDQKDDPNGKYGEWGQTSYFTFDEDGKGVFQNRFNYMAGREIEITGVTEEPVLHAFAVSNDLTRRGSFESSNDLLNQIYETDLWTFRANTINGVTMDCPHRERLGYGEVAFATAWGIGLPNYEAGSYYTKMIQGWMDVQQEGGNILFVAPTPNKTWGGTLWSSAPVTLTYETYRAYGDKRIIRKSYECMRSWLDFLNSHLDEDGILIPYDGGNRFLGEWSAPNDRKNAGKSPEAQLFNNCVYVMILDMFVEMAGAIGQTADVHTYTKRLYALRTNIHQKFFNEKKNNYINDIQTHLAFPLLSGVTPPEKRAVVMERFEKEILETTPYLDMGSSGLPILLKFLIEHAERGDIVYTHLNKETHPSYGYFLSRGETTWPEYWSSVKPSKIHTCYTGIASFHLKSLLGIQNAPGSIGYKHFQVKPGVFGDLEWAKGSLYSMYGVIRSGWQKHDDLHFTLDLTVPGNTQADIYIPKPAGSARNWAIRETRGLCWKQDRYVSGVPGIAGAHEGEGFVVIRVGSGTYRFISSTQ